MATPTDIERTSYGGPKGALQLGAHRQVIQSVGATRTLLAKESGALCLFDRTAGNVYTLPTPVEGMKFEFINTVAVVASDVSKVSTSAATVFIQGAVNSYKLAAGTDIFQADGTSHVGVSQNGGTTGGLIGASFTLTAKSATVWMITGRLVGSGTLATPFI